MGDGSTADTGELILTNGAGRPLPISTSISESFSYKCETLFPVCHGRPRSTPASLAIYGVPCVGMRVASTCSGEGNALRGLAATDVPALADDGEHLRLKGTFREDQYSYGCQSYSP